MNIKGYETNTLLDLIKNDMALTFNPAIDPRAPYAKHIFNKASKELIRTLITNIYHEAQDTEFDVGFETFRDKLKEIIGEPTNTNE